MEVEGGKITGTLTIEDGGTVNVYNGVVLDFDISPLSPGNDALVNDLSRIKEKGTPTFTVTARPGQATGVYRLAGGAAGFSSSLTVKCANEADVSITVGDNYVAGGGQAYALALEGGQLLLTVRDLDTTPPDKPVASASTTAPTNQSVTVTAKFSDDSVMKQYSTNNKTWKSYTKGIKMTDNGNLWFRGIDEAGNASEVTAYEVTNIDKVAPDAPNLTLSGDSVSHEVILHATWDKDDAVCRYAVDGAAAMHEYVEPLRIDKHTRIHFQTEDAAGNETDLRLELMFGRVTGVWSDKYFARNCIVEGMELEPLEGMNIIGDVFNGSDDSTSLVLTDDDNGDALFLDDLYSASPDISAKARISQVNMIIAGAGDDVIDLTSVRFQCADKGIAVQGGDGNDLIWANNNGTFLFGDAGDDRIVGGGSTDVIAGGSGNDTLHGGGGNDYFCFGGYWGDDTVEQLDGHGALLWFDGVKREDLSLSADAADNAVLSCDSGSVTLLGVRHDDVAASFDAGGNRLSNNILLQFGDSGLDEEFQAFADTLRNVGAFKEFTSDRIFDDQYRGTLA